MVDTTLALSLHHLAPPTAIGRALAARVVALLAALGVQVHQDTSPAVLDFDGGTPAPGAHVLVDGDTAVIVWPPVLTDAGLDLPMHAPDVMLDSLQALLEEIGTRRGGAPEFDTHRPSTCEREALVVWPVAQLGADVPPWRDPS
ncbi:hypothetical protein [Actinomycetospora soli]|uniref:hypothetical protein n=1 Tax=Actinomycetospora soli TaxID=2893887 RepID=UPI001E509BEB|nr:hypothetical protein [Actinomycetospora soli]MCD2191673.1 hypothetical protein [Actinomycetospora soli]